MNLERKRATDRRRNKRFRIRRAVEEKCLDCPAAAEPGRSRCAEHLGTHARASRAYYARRAAA